MIESLFQAGWAWVIAGAVIAGLEIVLPGAFLVWIGAGAIATGLILTIAPGLPLAWQALAFAASMLASLGVGVAVQRRGREDPEAATLNRELAQMVGRRYVASVAFVAGRGRIRVQDTTFAATSADAVAEGDLVEVTAIEEGAPRVRRVSP